MIKTFKDRETEKVYQRQFSPKLPSSIQQVALRKLRMLNNADNLVTCVSHRPITLRNLREKEPGNIVFALTTNGAFVLSGEIMMPMMSRLQIIIKLFWGVESYD